MRNQPGCAMVIVTGMVTFWPACTTVTAFGTGVPAVSPSAVLGTAAQGPFFCGPPTESCDIQLCTVAALGGAVGSVILKWAAARVGARRTAAPRSTIGV